VLPPADTLCYGLTTTAKHTHEGSQVSALTTETGKEFFDAQEALTFIRTCQQTMLDPGTTMVETAIATTEMVYAFRALDDYLSIGGQLPTSWHT
jgi:lipid A disaccharide synthetase